MSTIATTNLKNPSSGSNNIVLNSDGTANITTANITTANVTTLADSLGTNTSTPAAIAAGIAKAWVNFDGTSNSANLSGTYSQFGTTITVTATAHGLIPGNIIYADVTGLAVDGSYPVATVTDANTFTYSAGPPFTTSGNITIRRNPIRASHNVSSITDNGTGVYTVNFTTALPDANYAVHYSSGPSGGGGTVVEYGGTTPTTTSVRVVTYFYSTGANADRPHNSVSIFR